MSAVIKEKHIETIFDYDLTDEEKNILVFNQSIDEYLATHDQDAINLSLMFLFSMRGDKQRSEIYKNKLDADFVKTHLNWDRVSEAI